MYIYLHVISKICVVRVASGEVNYHLVLKTS